MNPPPDRGIWKCSNGDTLDDLNERFKEVSERYGEASKEFQAAKEALRPFRDKFMEAEMEKLNIECRLNTWWNEYRAFQKAQAAPKDL